MTEPNNFDNLRVWGGSQHRAFEELSFQLLKHDVPQGSRAIRTGNPDGGVEWYVSLADGSEWGWQAKYVKGIEALLNAMTGSVRRVVKERPNLTKLTFVISSNLAAGTSGRERKSQRQKYDDKVKTWQKTITGADKIRFDLVQESDLLDELAKPEHVGRRWFWWGDLALGHEWLEQRHSEQASAASDKYRPDLQVDVPIQEDLLGLGFDEAIRVLFEGKRRDLLSAIDDVRPPSDGDDEAARFCKAVFDTAILLKSAADALVFEAGDRSEVFTSLIEQMSVCLDAVRTAEEHERKLVAEWRDLAKDDPKKDTNPPEWARGYSVRGLRFALDELLTWFRSSVGRTFRQRAYFLTGQAGSGKTHLLLDATRRSLDARRPAVFLAGARFGDPSLWASITDQLGLGQVGSDVLLSAMDSAGEAASTVGTRFLILIDALNETTPPNFWMNQLPALRAAIARYPHVALAVSCRDTYQDLVVEVTEATQYVCCAHPGFAEREVEASQRYFAHYNLEAPTIPLLTPEFSLPLFLRLFCESLANREGGDAPTGHQGRVAIFDRYLACKTGAVARRFRPTAISGYELGAARTQVIKVINALLDEMSRTGRESMSAATAEMVARAHLDNCGADATKIMGLLQEEGVLTRERLYLGNGEYDEGVRIVFQAFADFLLVKRRFALSSDPLHDEAVISWLREECSWGVTEAATVLLPEAYGVELPDLLNITLSDRPDSNEDRDALSRYNRTAHTYRSLVQTLPYRDSQAISKRTIDLLNVTQGHMSRSEFYRVLFTIAPQSGNRLNGEGLHNYLTRQRMWRRDSDFGFATYHGLSDPSSPVARLARWAADGPFPTYEAEVIELASIPLCWLLSSPNRFMRDWVTKALVQLLHGHLDVMHALVQRFWSVDDPYVVQRVVAIAYGALLRSKPTQFDQAKSLVELVHQLVFTAPVRADELLLDAARGVVRWGTGQGLIADSASVSADRPYGLKPPGPAPSKQNIEAKYGWHKGQADSQSYASINFSLLDLGDFGRYVVESGLHYFSRYRIGQNYPESARRPRLIKSRWKIFISSLNDDQRRQFACAGGDAEAASRLGSPFRTNNLSPALTKAQRALLDMAVKYPKVIDDGYPAARARRWVFQRTISLGWTPARFGLEDRTLGHGRGREGHKAERWGKKYQWMAYHELLARVADNYQPARTFSNEESYEGLHQLTGDREIDPSLPPIDFPAFNENSGADATAWEEPFVSLPVWHPARLDFGMYRGSADAFLADTMSEPSVSQTLIVNDTAGGEWAVLEGFFKQVDPAANKGWMGLQQHTSLNTLFVKAGGANAIHAAVAAWPTRDVHDLIDTRGHIDCCYVGEVGRTGPACPNRHDAFRTVAVRDISFEAVSTVEEYLWEGSILDCSIGESAKAVLPSTFIQQAEALSFDMRGPSWLDDAQLPVFAYCERPEDESHALLVRASFLKKFLSVHDIELLAVHWFERMLVGGFEAASHPYVESTTVAVIGPDLLPRESQRLRFQR